MKILVIDDEKLDLFIANKLLNMEYEAIGFSDPDEAYQWASANGFDIAIIDYYLTPPVLADQVLTKLREATNQPFRPFVLTNYVDVERERELLKQGFEGIITKPITLEKFRALILRQ